MKKLKKRSKQITSLRKEVLEVNLDDSWEEIIRENEKRTLYEKHLNLLAERCQELLKWSFEKIPMIEIAHRKGFSSEDVAKNEVHKCRNRLDKSIKDDPDYRDIIS
jgi:hypothetical protein